MKKYLSLGGGVNSTALFLLLLDEGEEFEVIFADPGSEYPETYANIECLFQLHPITVLPGKVDGLYLFDYCMKYQILPLRFARWCTDKFKVRIIHNYVEKPCIMWIGIDAGESHRVRFANKPSIENEYPLVDRGINRAMCKKIIEEHGLEVPPKSGCFFCPFQRKGEFTRLRIDYPDLFCKARRMEQVVNERLAKEGRKPLYLLDAPIDVIAKKDQLDMFGWHRPCMCEL